MEQYPLSLQAEAKTIMRMLERSQHLTIGRIERREGDLTDTAILYATN